MPDIKLTFTMTASLAALPKNFVLDPGSGAVDAFTMKKLTLRGKVGKRVKLVTVKLVEGK